MRKGEEKKEGRGSEKMREKKDKTKKREKWRKILSCALKNTLYSFD